MGHFYTQAGQAAHFQPKKDGTGTRPTTIADARKLNLLPSVTTILQVIAKPGLQNWIARQNVLAVVTAPDRPGESLDDKITRILEVDQEQNREAAQAADLGTRIHAAIEQVLNGQEIEPDLHRWIDPALAAVRELCPKTVATEIVLVGQGYAGKADLIATKDGPEVLIDFKTAKNLPLAGSWPEHRLQLSAYAYARAFRDGPEGLVAPFTANCYISTTEPGKFALHQNADWYIEYLEGFDPLLKYWQWANAYRPNLNPAPA